MQEDENPYAAPATPVDDVAHSAAAGELIAEGRSAPPGDGWDWIVSGFKLFMLSPGIWILIFILAFVIMAFVSVVPFGQFATNLLYPVFAAGILLGCDAQANGEPLEVAHLFAGFRERFGQLLVVSLLYMVGVIAVFLVASLIFGISMLASGVGFWASMSPLTVLLYMLVVLALLMPLVMTVWFAPALVVFHDVAPVDAMKQSFLGCLKNIVPFLVYGLIASGLGFLASIPLFLGWLVLMPTLMASVYFSYRDIFVRVP